MLFLFIVYCCSITAFDCSRQLKNNHITPAVYYWRTSFYLSPYDLAVLDSLNVRKLYLRCFDVDWNPGAKSPRAVAPLIVSMPAPDSVEIIPTVFITNKVMLNIPTNAIPELAQNLLHKIFVVASLLRLTTIKEIQLDCDWTERSREKYFFLLSSLHKILASNNIALSATIRLHQLALQEQTGIPPVQRGVLMFYNMGNLKNPTGKSSILDVDIGRQYVEASAHYPLPLDIALPIFQWCVVIRRGNVVNLFERVDHTSFSDSSKFERISSVMFRVKRSQYTHEQYVYKDDILRIEQASFEDLQKSVEVLRDNDVVSPRATIILFHYDSLQYQRYGYENLRNLFNSFN